MAKYYETTLRGDNVYESLSEWSENTEKPWDANPRHWDRLIVLGDIKGAGQPMGGPDAYKVLEGLLKKGLVRPVGGVNDTLIALEAVNRRLGSAMRTYTKIARDKPVTDAEVTQALKYLKEENEEFPVSWFEDNLSPGTEKWSPFLLPEETKSDRVIKLDGIISTVHDMWLHGKSIRGEYEERSAREGELLGRLSQQLRDEGLVAPGDKVDDWAEEHRRAEKEQEEKSE